MAHNDDTTRILLNHHPLQDISFGKYANGDFILRDDGPADIFGDHQLHDVKDRARRARGNELPAHDFTNFVGQHGSPPAVRFSHFERVENRDRLTQISLFSLEGSRASAQPWRETLPQMIAQWEEAC